MFLVIFRNKRDIPQVLICYETCELKVALKDESVLLADIFLLESQTLYCYNPTSIIFT